MDGTPFNFKDWDKTQPSNTLGSDCGAVKMPSGLWIADDCAIKMKPYVCSIQTAPPTAPPTTPMKPLSCPIGWVYNNATKFCYKVLINSNWLDAEDVCKVEGAHLTSIHNLAEALWVASMEANKQKDSHFP